MTLSSRIADLATRVGQEIKKRPTFEQAEQIALDNALLNEDQPVRRAFVKNGSLVLVRRDGLEITVEGNLDTPVSVTRSLRWQDVSIPCDFGWVCRVGDRVLLRLVNPRITQNQPIWTPPTGWAVGSVGNNSTFISALVTEHDGTLRSAQQSAHMYGSAIYADAKLGSTTPNEPDPVARLDIEWLSFDEMDTSGTLGTSPFASGGVLA